ncbi:conserved hypothetical protein [Thiomonas arsenitoxydans]|uniref:Uncharacterized protein n=1 Tax=Thiomonas arsenitoxydans (strain DSM 22701 / CIP 110005 / 3As) TaxID=426114 RepID=D6CMI9_THIA3|nr:hypothetical protein THI_3169 [Thiomonas arsenitoxydans]CQR44633.1 conserved hypothetical protein [Thiomonas sp. CB3]CQR31590.1 conserved hypothetical protein [Thiomonas arsenitoxydans]CQR36349.1 conserved hypothetical protein [Thiomonas arsenitoxydans]CQR39392.1 conserved hypothetical protein [Thiomonas arsenitoxydans]
MQLFYTDIVPAQVDAARLENRSIRPTIPRAQTIDSV